jgi:carbonic anhydrase
VSRIPHRDLFASFIVSLVAMPLSIGIALASGAPVGAGVISAVVGGIVVGLLTGAPLQVSGPAAGLIVVVAGLVPEFGWETVCLITACAGVLQALLGIFKLADGVLMIAPAVLHGLLAGLGVSVALTQMRGLFSGANETAMMLGIVTVAMAFLWQWLGWKKIPGTLVAVMTATLISIMLKMDVARVHMPKSFGGAGLTLPENADWGALVAAVITLMLVASIESLLCASTTDRMHEGKRANLDMELSAQGAGNVLAGLLGGLPVAGVIVRSTANVRTGAVSRWSAVMQGLWVLLFAFFFGRAVESIPLAVLAGLLTHVSLNLIELQALRSRQDITLYAATLLGVVFGGVLWGAGIGIGLSVLILTRRVGRTEVQVEKKTDRWNLKLAGTLAFASLPVLNEALSRIPEGQPVKLDLALEYIDYPVFEALQQWRKQQEESGGQVMLDEFHEMWFNTARQTPRGQRIRCRV